MGSAKDLMCAGAKKARRHALQCIRAVNGFRNGQVHGSSELMVSVLLARLDIACTAMVCEGWTIAVLGWAQADDAVVVTAARYKRQMGSCSHASTSIL